MRLNEKEEDARRLREVEEREEEQRRREEKLLQEAKSVFTYFFHMLQKGCCLSIKSQHCFVVQRLSDACARINKCQSYDKS